MIGREYVEQTFWNSNATARAVRLCGEDLKNYRRCHPRVSWHRHSIRRMPALTRPYVPQFLAQNLAGAFECNILDSRYRDTPLIPACKPLNIVVHEAPNMYGSFLRVASGTRFSDNLVPISFWVTAPPVRFVLADKFFGRWNCENLLEKYIPRPRVKGFVNPPRHSPSELID